MIDLRSDTVTLPCEGMRKAMASADVGDDVFGEDPTVSRLEAMIAEMFGKDKALFTPTGTQANLIALLSHCERGEEYIVGQQAHNYKFEAGGAAVLGSIQPQPLNFEDNGTLDFAKVKAAIKPDDFHFARTKLLCLENTISGKVLPLDYLNSVSQFCNDNKLSAHLDGARIFNASVKTNVSVQDLTKSFDTVSVCLSKGLGTPAGSILAGPADLIGRAKRWRKMLGGGMRQIGIIAAAGIYALENNIARLQQDHDNALHLAQSLAHIPCLAVDPAKVQTNILFIRAPENKGSVSFHEFMKQKNIKIGGGTVIRLVTHLNISEEDIPVIASAIEEYCSQ